jgi:hypothetical protein
MELYTEGTQHLVESSCEDYRHICGSSWTQTLYALTAGITAVPRLDTFYSSSSIHVDQKETMHENGHARSEAKAASSRASIK